MDRASLRTNREYICLYGAPFTCSWIENLREEVLWQYNPCSKMVQQQKIGYCPENGSLMCSKWTCTVGIFTTANLHTVLEPFYVYCSKIAQKWLTETQIGLYPVHWLCCHSRDNWTTWTKLTFKTKSCIYVWPDLPGQETFRYNKLHILRILNLFSVSTQDPFTCSFWVFHRYNNI